jgi:hypothetical protein
MQCLDELIARHRLLRRALAASQNLFPGVRPETAYYKALAGETVVGNSSESVARETWNAEADEFNQWDSLGQDEKDELIARHRLLRRALAASQNLFPGVRPETAYYKALAGETAYRKPK